MVQVLDEVPSFGSQMARGLGGMLGNFAGGALQGHIEKKHRESQDEALKRLTGKDLSGLSPEFQKFFADKLARTPEHERIVDAFTKQGFSPDDAEFFAILSTGGQTALVKDMLESKKRTSKFPATGAQEEVSALENEMSDSKKAYRDLQKELELQDEGLTPKERIARGKERYSGGLKEYQEAGSKLRDMARDKERFGILDTLNKSKKLPKDLGRLNVDKDGNLRLPFLASAESQRFVKTLNEFSQGAKGTFGSRVTNFDLQQYLKRFPTLLNSEEGRRQLIDQMKIVNQINSAYYKNLKKVYDRSGGVRNIDSDRAEKYAERITEPKVANLVKKFETIGEFETLPSAEEHKGRVIENPQTGERLKSDGKTWTTIG